MRANEVKRKLKAGEVVVGSLVGFPSPEVVEMCGYVGYDYVLIDAEHGPMTIESAYHMVLAAEASGTTPLIRVSNKEPDTILRHMDIGAAGIMIPQVNTAAEARAVVEAVKYHPLGHRGLASVRPTGFGQRLPLREYTQVANEETMVVVQFENIAALDHVAEIARTPGVDVIFVGPSDLSHSMGLPGQPDHADVRATIDKVLEICTGSDVALGMIASTPEAANGYIERGFRMIVTGAGGIFSQGNRHFLSNIKR